MQCLSTVDITGGDHDLAALRACAGVHTGAGAVVHSCACWYTADGTARHGRVLDEVTAMAEPRTAASYGCKVSSELRRAGKEKDVSEVDVLTLDALELSIRAEEVGDGGGLARSAAAGDEEDEDAPLDSLLPASIPCTEMKKTVRRILWRSWLGSGSSQSTAVLDGELGRGSVSWEKEMERERKESEGQASERMREVRRRGTLILLTSRQESVRGGVLGVRRRTER